MKNKTYFKQPKWKLCVYYSNISNIIPFIQKSYSLKTPLWKDKYGTPRVEQTPYITLYWFGIAFKMIKGTEQYWEKHLWIHKYNNGDEQQAIDTWGWIDSETKNSTWFK